MSKMLIIADDLTGAADCAVTCASCGLRTIVVVGDGDGETDTDVLAIDGNTRRLADAEAASAVKRLLKKHGGDTSALIYKKLDSTMRGPLGAELAAMIKARREMSKCDERIVAVLAPAFPATGRTTVHGRQLINGQPLEQTAFAQFGGFAVSSDLSVLTRKAGLSPALVDLSLIRGNLGALKTAMVAMARDADVLICDAETDDDLRSIAEASVTLGRSTVWAGSAGMARFLPAAAGLSGTEVPFALSAVNGRPVLYVVGSAAPSSRESAETLAARSDTIAIRVSPEVLLSGSGSILWSEFSLTIDRSLNQRKDVVVLLEAGAEIDRRMGGKLTSALAEHLRPYADGVGALVATGGETARALFDAWGICKLEVIGEVETGLPFSITSGWHREIPVLTKAGGFGDAETFLRCRKFLHGLEHGVAPTMGLREGHE